MAVTSWPNRNEVRGHFVLACEESQNNVLHYYREYNNGQPVTVNGQVMMRMFPIGEFADPQGTMLVQLRGVGWECKVYRVSNDEVQRITGEDDNAPQDINRCDRSNISLSKRIKLIYRPLIRRPLIY